MNLVPLLTLSGESIVQQAGGIHTIRLAGLLFCFLCRKNANTVIQLSD